MHSSCSYLSVEIFSVMWFIVHSEVFQNFSYVLIPSMPCLVYKVRHYFKDTAGDEST